MADLCVRRGIDGGGGVVQDQDAGLFQQCAGNAEALLLAAGDVVAALLDVGLVLVGEALDKFIGACLLAGVLDLGVGGVGVAPAQVLGNRAAEQLVLLQHHGDVVAQGVEVISAHINAADGHAALGHVVQTRQQLHKAGLSRTGAANDADGLAGLDVEINVLEGLLAILFIGKADVVELDGAVPDLHNGVLTVRQVGLLVQHLGHALGGGCRHRDHDEHHGQHHQAHKDVHAVAQHAHQVAGGEGRCAGADDKLGTDPGDEQDAAVDGQLHERGVPGQDQLGTHQQIAHILAGLAELLALKLLAHIGLDNADGGDILLHALVQVVVLAECLAEVLGGAAHNKGERTAQQDDGDQIDVCQPTVDRVGHDQRHDHAGGRTHRHAQQHLVGVLDVGDVGGHAGDQARGGVLVNVGKAEGLDVAEHAAAQVAGKARGRVGAGHRAQNAEQQAEQRRDDHLCADGVDDLHIARRDAVVNDGGHQLRDDHFHDDLRDHKDRRQHGDQAEALGFTSECF